MTYHHAQQPSRSVTKVRKRTSHTFHLIMSICTCGVWALLVWFPLAMWHRYGPRRREVTRYR